MKEWVEFMPGVTATERERNFSSFSVRWRAPCPLPAFLPSLPTGRKYWPACEITFAQLLNLFATCGLHA